MAADPRPRSYQLLFLLCTTDTFATGLLVLLLSSLTVAFCPESRIVSSGVLKPLHEVGLYIFKYASAHCPALPAFHNTVVAAAVLLHCTDADRLYHYQEKKGCK